VVPADHNIISKYQPFGVLIPASLLNSGGGTIQRSGSGFALGGGLTTQPRVAQSQTKEDNVSHCKHRSNPETSARASKVNSDQAAWTWLNTF
jgi:hypothetical protein